ncbi:MAG: hypothetical protein A2W99_09125 [Bacteroidetes bacterium GWF2_33_16]|nr:MAG: hypothetical protein A2X00_07570 [Bacteroidetes bacterium GWE2_32_14]OFY03772.1 MAG: hypothetical protein A2W99_09125 [Bacteroidetes bacterium GWF2_33_16]
MIKNIFLVVILQIALLHTNAQDKGFKPVDDITGLKNKLNELTANSQTIQSDFVQEKHLSFLSENIISKGKFAFKNPNLLRWEYAEPINYIIVFNNKNILISDDGKISSFDTQSNKMFSEINNMMVGTIQGSLFNDSERFSVKYYESDKQYLLDLEPKMAEMKSMLKTIKIFIDKTDNSVASIKMIESSDDYTKIDFINRKLNQPIIDDNFRLK